MRQKRSLDGVEIFSVDRDDLIGSLVEISRRIGKDMPLVREVILFGSFAGEEYTPRSDVDIAIVVDSSDRDFVERSDDFLGYFADLPFDVNIVVYTSQEVERMIRDRNRFIGGGP